MALKPQVAGRIFPTVCKLSGSSATGNMMPDSIMEGRKMSCVAIPTLEELFIKSPKTMPTQRLAIVTKSKSKKYCTKFAGITASKNTGAVKKIIRPIMNKCTKQIGRAHV